jgi:hypothetical protein
MDDWDKALHAFETLYGRKDKQEENDPNTFRLQNQFSLRRIPLDTLETFDVQSRGQPAMTLRLNEARTNKRFIDTLYSLVPADSNTVEELPVVMEYKPDLRYLVIKDISIKRIWKEKYEQMKTTSIFRKEHAQAQSLSAAYLNPENILKRVNFKLTETEQETADTNEPDQAAETKRQNGESEAET